MFSSVYDLLIKETKYSFWLEDKIAFEQFPINLNNLQIKYKIFYLYFLFLKLNIVVFTLLDASVSSHSILTF